MRESITEAEWRRMLPIRRREFRPAMESWCGCRCCHACCMTSDEPPPILKMLFQGKRPAILPHLFGFSTPDEDEGSD